MQLRYREASDLKERALKQAAASQENLARQAQDPLERYRARCLADMLELEAKIMKFEQAPTALPHPSLEEQRALANRAEADFAQIKQLLDDGNVSRLDALRLNNDFRRIGPERDRLLKTDLSSIEVQLQYYEKCAYQCRARAHRRFTARPDRARYGPRATGLRSPRGGS